MALRTFTATRAPAVGDGKFLKSWALKQGTGAQIVRLCDGTNATPLIEIQVPANTSASQSYSKKLFFPKGLHVEVVNTGFVRGCIDV